MKNWEHRHTHSQESKEKFRCKQEIKVFKEIMVYNCPGDVKVKEYK